MLNVIQQYVNTYTYEFINTLIDCYNPSKMQAMPIFGDNLKAARKKIGLTQEGVAERLGLIRTNYVPYETGLLPSDETMQAIAEVLNLPVSRLKAWKIIQKEGVEVAFEIARQIGADTAYEVLKEKHKDAEIKSSPTLQGLMDLYKEKNQ